ncbi:hypothetical protein B0H13DRAFT_2675337 [Mycena leptocephala]|nr:hypothetical protein B0H13DRAFT_2675337 [Mycena leptocephala]
MPRIQADAWASAGACVRDIHGWCSCFAFSCSIHILASDCLATAHTQSLFPSRIEMAHGRICGCDSLAQSNRCVRCLLAPCHPAQSSGPSGPGSHFWVSSHSPRWSERSALQCARPHSILIRCAAARRCVHLDGLHSLSF